MTLPDPPSLTHEERELAQRLARLGPHGEPTPALDARILAAAHAAAAVAPVRLPRHLPRRWPMVLGLAASLVLAVGIAWQLRPLPETRPAHGSEAVSAMREESPPTPAAGESTVDGSLPVTPAKASAMDSGDAAKPQAAESAPQTPERTSRPAVSPSPAAEPAVVFDKPAPASASATVAAKAADLQQPTAAVTALPMAGAPQAFGKAATAAAPTASDAAAGSSDRQAQASKQAGMAQAANAAPAARGDEPLDDIPPATADSPAVRDAWLQRIHALIDSGESVRARDSLREFVRRYPAYPLPEDLHTLER
jgi:hypothetical protein